MSLSQIGNGVANYNVPRQSSGQILGQPIYSGPQVSYIAFYGLFGTDPYLQFGIPKPVLSESFSFGLSGQTAPPKASDVALSIRKKGTIGFSELQDLFPYFTLTDVPIPPGMTDDQILEYARIKNEIPLLRYLTKFITGFGAWMVPVDNAGKYVFTWASNAQPKSSWVHYALFPDTTFNSGALDHANTQFGVIRDVTIQQIINDFDFLLKIPQADKDRIGVLTTHISGAGAVNATINVIGRDIIFGAVAAGLAAEAIGALSASAGPMASAAGTASPAGEGAADVGGQSLSDIAQGGDGSLSIAQPETAPLEPIPPGGPLAPPGPPTLLDQLFSAGEKKLIALGVTAGTTAVTNAVGGGKSPSTGPSQSSGGSNGSGAVQGDPVAELALIGGGALLLLLLL